MSDMSNELRRLFDYQKFENEETLNKVISDCRLIPPAIERQELKPARTPVTDQQEDRTFRTPFIDQSEASSGTSVNDQQGVIPFRTSVTDQQEDRTFRTPVTDQQGARIGRYTGRVAKLNDEDLEMVNAAGNPRQDPNKLIHISNPVDIIGNLFDPLIPGIRRFIQIDDDDAD